MRVKPNFDKKDQTKNHERLSCSQSLWVLVIGYLVLSAINLVFANLGSRLGQIICIGTVICVILVFVWDSRKKDQENERLQEERQRWKSACKSAEVAVVSRQSAAYESYFDDYGDLHNGKSSYSLDLETTVDQKAVNPNLAIISVKVYSDIYEVLQDRKTVCIYYKPEDPLTFLLEEEI
jgi:hypothetical protein